MAPVGYYQPGTEHQAAWDWFMTTVARGDADTVSYLQQVAGSACWGRALTNLFVIFGPSGTGKTTFLTTLAEVLGHGRGGYAETTQYRYWTRQGSDSLTAQDHLASLAGARLVVCNEADTRALDMTLLKSVIDGGSQVTAGRKHKGTFSYQPRFTFMLSTNEAPRFNGGDSDGSKRRVRMVEFRHQFVRSDALETGDDDWRARYADPNGIGVAVLFWAVQGAVALRQNGFRLAPPKAVRTTTTAYHLANDPLGAWFSERVVRDEGGLLFTRYARDAFHLWCEENGVQPLSETDIHNRLSELVKSVHPDIQKSQRRPGPGHNPSICYVGLRLRLAEELVDDAEAAVAGAVAVPPAPAAYAAQNEG